MADDKSLGRYRAKRDFGKTPEPRGVKSTPAARQFVVQKHAARRLHYDLRLELDGTFKSWAVPKGPSLDPVDKRIAVHVEDHPLEYGSFEGVIPEKQYGAGTVIIWDRGTWTPLGDADRDYAAGKLKFTLDGEKLRGAWMLVRMKPKPGERKELWLLIKEHDGEARPAASYDITEAMPDSVIEAPRASLKKSSARSAVSSGRAARLPLALAPQLATLVAAPPTSDGWDYELKFDGYRLLARVDGDDVRLFTRNGHDWTSRMPHLQKAIQRLKLGSAWLDGEIVVVGPDGRPDFQALQNAFDKHSTATVQYYVFDLPFFEGRDLRETPLHERRTRLERLLAGTSVPIRFSQSFGNDALRVLQAVAAMGGEGVIGKRLDSKYVSGRSTSWIKLKTTQRQEFVVVGYTDPRGRRSGFGALVLAVNDAKGDLVYAGTVGSGFDEKTLSSLKKRLAALETDKPRFKGLPQELKAHFVKPNLVAEVSFSQWTNDGVIRHPVFRGLREEKAPSRIVREVAVSLASARPRAVSAVKVTHGDRVIDSSTGLTKLDLVEYYRASAPFMLEHIKGRPVALVRAPAGINGQVFFQKQPDTLKFPGLSRIDEKLNPGHGTMMSFATVDAIVHAAQLNVVEFHPWNATARAIEKPDRVIFDLDPGEKVPFERVVEAALLTRTMLEELELTSFIKTSGGKGLHVVVPISPRLGWESVKRFADAVVQHLERVFPSRFVSKSGAHNRIGKIFIDVGRNLRGATTVAAYSARARPGLGVSMPIGWDELPAIRSGDQWTIVTAPERLRASAQAWQDIGKARQSLGSAMRRLG